MKATDHLDCNWNHLVSPETSDLFAKAEVRVLF